MDATTSRKIIIASFETPDGAGAALDLLKAAPVDLGNVAIVKRDHDGKVDFTETQDWGVGKSALVGAIAGLPAARCRYHHAGRRWRTGRLLHRPRLP